MEDKKRADFEKAEKYRALLGSAVDAQLVASLDDEWNKRTIGTGDEYRIEFWWRAIKNHAPEVAYRECPNRDLHDGYLVKWHDKCPACGTPLVKACARIESISTNKLES